MQKIWVKLVLQSGRNGLNLLKLYKIKSNKVSRGTLIVHLLCCPGPCTAGGHPAGPQGGQGDCRQAGQTQAEACGVRHRSEVLQGEKQREREKRAIKRERESNKEGDIDKDRDKEKIEREKERNGEREKGNQREKKRKRNKEREEKQRERESQRGREGRILFAHLQSVVLG